MKKIFFFFAIASMMIFSTCNGGNKNDEDNSSPHRRMMELNLTEQGMPLSIMVPDSTVGPLEVEALDYGEIEIRVGSMFQLKIAEGGDIQQKKTDLNEDLLWKSNFLADEPNMLLYQSDLPDGSKTFYHFYTVIKVNNIDYEIQDLEMGDPFPQKAIEKMLEAAKGIKAAVAAS
ncbi:hypothetical protein JYU20_03100 [Bacteroidales bacterium AH-315-I05]|nr:hypothetical protein [Bacteroidales bacterium AH-315-I05]